MKATHGPVCLLIVVLLGACSVQGVATAIPATATPTLPPPAATATPTQAPATAHPTPTPRPTLTPTAAVTPLCPPASTPGGWECREYADGGGTVRARRCAPAPLAEAEWLCYEDLDLGFALEYPASLQPSRGSLAVPKDPTAHVGKIEFVGAWPGFLLDIWLSSEPDLTAWLAKMDRVAVGWRLPVTEPNATVGGRPAIVFAENPETAPSSLTVFFRDGAYVYRLWRWGLCYRSGERLIDDAPMLRRILDSIRFSPEPVAAHIPDDFWQEAMRKCTP